MIYTIERDGYKFKELDLEVSDFIDVFPEDIDYVSAQEFCENNISLASSWKLLKTEFSDIEEFYEEFFNYIEKSTVSEKIKRELTNFDSDNYLENFPFYSKSDKKFRYIRDEILTKQEYFRLMDTLILENGINLDTVYSKLWITEKDLKKINNKDHLIGLHSYSHPTKFSSLSYNDQEKEYKKNKNHLEKITSKVFTMSHPTNSYNQDTLSILKKLGIKIGFRADMFYPFKSNLEIPRQDHSIISRMLKN